jgi:hypothetical protein
MSICSIIMIMVVYFVKFYYYIDYALFSMSLSTVYGQKDGRPDGQTDRGKTVYPPPPSGSGGIMTNKTVYTLLSLIKHKFHILHVYYLNKCNLLKLLFSATRESPLFLINDTLVSEIVFTSMRHY